MDADVKAAVICPVAPVLAAQLPGSGTPGPQQQGDGGLPAASSEQGTALASGEQLDNISLGKVRTAWDLCSPGNRS